MYEYKIVVSNEKGGEQVFIVNTDSGTTKEAEDEIRYLVTNSLEVVSITKIDIR